MGQRIHEPSLCDRAKRCINNKSDCPKFRYDRKRGHLSNGNQRPQMDGSTSPTTPSQGAINQATPSQALTNGFAPYSGAMHPATINQATLNQPRTYSFVPMPDAPSPGPNNQAVPNQPPTYTFVPIPGAPSQGVANQAAANQPSTYTFAHRAAVENQRPPVNGSPNPAAPHQDVASLTAPDQATSNSRQAMTDEAAVNQTNQAAADQALVNEVATMLAIACQIPLHQAAAIRGPVRFTVNQAMAPSHEVLFLQMLVTGVAQGGALRRWAASEHAQIIINETSFILGDDSDNQPIAGDQNAPPFTDQAAADQALVNHVVTELAAANRPTGTANRVTMGFLMRLYSQMFNAGGIQCETVRRWIQSGNARLPVNLEGPRLTVASVESPNGIQIAAQPTLSFQGVDGIDNNFQRRILREQQLRLSLQQEQPNGSSLRRMEMRVLWRRNALELGIDALSPGNNSTAIDSGTPDVDDSQMVFRTVGELLEHSRRQSNR